MHLLWKIRGDVGGYVLINENGNEVFTTSLNSEEGNSNED